jgi:hypothetical protein
VIITTTPFKRDIPFSHIIIRRETGRLDGVVVVFEMSHVSIAESLTTRLLLRNRSRVVKLSAIET